MSFRIAPGVRIRASSRGLSAGLGPRAARVHLGTRGVGVSTGVGPVSAYQSLGGRFAASPRRATHGPTKAQIAAYEREVKVAQRDAHIERVKHLEESLVNVHRQTFPEANRLELPPIEPVDEAPIRQRLEAAAEIPQLLQKLGGDGRAAPVAPDPEPVDRYALMREHRRRERQGIPIYSLRERIAAAKRADQMAVVAADEEEERRREAQRQQQARLDRLWAELTAARRKLDQDLTVAVEAESGRRQRARAQEQAELNEEWARLQQNDPEVTLAALEAAFADNRSPAAPIDCRDRTTTVVMQFPHPGEIVPERMPARTPTGKPTLKKRNKTEANEFYLRSLASNVLATVSETFAVAPGTDTVRMLVIRREFEGRQAGDLAAVYIGEFGRLGFAGAHQQALPSTLLSAAHAELNLKGKTNKVAPIDLSDQPQLAMVIEAVAEGLDKSGTAEIGP